MKQTLMLSLVAALMAGCVAVPGDYGYRDHGYYGDRSYSRGYYRDHGYYGDRGYHDRGYWRRYPNNDR